MSAIAQGSFEVVIKPFGEDAPGRMSLDKVYSGDLAATGKGEMLTAMTGTSGSAGYVAIELVTGTLAGRQGSFVLQHAAMMARGVSQFLDVLIVPDSGSGGLLGIAGKLVIKVVERQHFYELTYTLPA
ncbi:MAG: DUF3224 domain-containing protein [Pseudomonadota bacterium]